MSSHKWWVVPLVVFAPAFRFEGLGAGAVAQELEGRAAGETMSTGQWKKQLGEWLVELREAHRTGEGSAEAIKEEIRNIRDPNAVPALEAMLADGSDYPRIVFLEPLAHIGGPDALRVLVRVSVTDGNVSVRKAAAEWITKMENRKDAVAEYIKYLRSPKYSGSAAEGLSASGLTKRDRYKVDEPDPDLTHALINALVLKGTKYVPVDHWRECWYHNPVGVGKGVAWRGQTVTTLVRLRFPIANRQVLRTLVEYTGQDYGYDQAAWKKWYQKRRASLLRKGT